MLVVVTGPRGSGKTARVLARFREAVRAGSADTKLVVPTTTLVEHRRHELAREGLVFRPEGICTLARLARDLAAPAEPVSSAAFAAAVERSLQRLKPAGFGRVLDAPGFPLSAAKTLERLDAAGLAPEDLERVEAVAPHAGPLAGVWRDVMKQLERRGATTRAGLLLRAARRGAAMGGGTLLFDGFSVFSEPELRFLESLAKASEVMVTLPADAPVRERTLERGWREERLEARSPGRARVRHFAGESLEREGEEIARRVLLEAERGLPFQKMGVALRHPDRYRAMLEAVLERFGIPARFYFSTPFERHPAARFLVGSVEACLGDWEHESCVAALRCQPYVGSSSELDRFDFAVRAQLPHRGLEALPPLGGASGLQWILDAWRRMEGWRTARLTPGEWGRRLAWLRGLFLPGDANDWEEAARARGSAAALELWESVLDEAGAWFDDPGARISLADFWAVAKPIARHSSFTIIDRRRNVVHVVSVYEARQWDLDIVFIPGLAEREFPRRHAADPFLPDAALVRLRDEGFLVQTTAERDAEERELFDAVAGRAREEVVLSYSTAGQNLLSVFFPSGEPEAARPVRPREVTRRAAPPSQIRSADLLPVLAERSAKPSVTGLENYLQCPFLYFSEKTLRLRPAPPRPAERLDALAAGNIVHEVLKRWAGEQIPMELLFDEVFEQQAARYGFVSGYRTARVREQMLGDLRRFVRHVDWPASAGTVVEKEIEIEITVDVRIKARIDRLEAAADGSAVIVDYKYSNAAATGGKVKDETRLQGPLYVYATRLKQAVAAMVFMSLRRSADVAKPQIIGWGELPSMQANLRPLEVSWVDEGVRAAREAVSGVRAGITVPQPADLAKCRWCDFRDVCRFQAETAPAAGTG